MSTGHRVRLWLAAVAAGVLIALMIAPGTRWVLARQIGWQLWPRTMAALPGWTGDMGLFGASCSHPNPRAAENPQRRIAAAAARNPQDFRIQLAYALMGGSGQAKYPEEQIQRMQGLLRRFPDNPSAYANLLRYQSIKLSGGSLYGENELSGQAPPANRPPGAAATSTADWEGFVKTAEMGERVDPDNAFFPLMRAYGLFGLNRMREAGDCVLVAGTKPRWEDYTTDEVLGKWRLEDDALGPRTAISRLAVASTVLYPHFARLRAMARAATYQAVLMEQAGNMDGGLAVRMSLMHVGSLMRVESQSLIGTQVGMAMERITLQRPGGTPPESPARGTSSVGQEQARIQKFAAYVDGLGHTGDAKWVQAEFAAGDEARSIMRRTMDGALFGPLLAASRGWLAGSLILANAFWTLMLAGLVWAARRPRAAAKDQNLLQSAAWSIGLGVLGLALVALWQAPALEAMSRLWFVEISMAQLAGPAPPLEASTSVPIMYLAVPFAIPLLLLAVLAAASRLRKGPVLSDLGQGLRAAALPIACVLLFAYGVAVIGTARQESVASGRVASMVQHEGQTYAELIGAKWPGAVR